MYGCWWKGVSLGLIIWIRIMTNTGISISGCKKIFHLTSYDIKYQENRRNNECDGQSYRYLIIPLYTFIVYYSAVFFAIPLYFPTFYYYSQFPCPSIFLCLYKHLPHTTIHLHLPYLALHFFPSPHSPKRFLNL